MKTGKNKKDRSIGYIVKGREFTAPQIEPGLYIAATPIGNLSDITLRVLDTLAGCDLIACEDTRVTGKLLRHFAIDTRKIAYHEHNAEVTGPKLIEEIKAGRSVALVSDAGTPLVSDPGFRLVEACRNEGLNVVPLPGASAPVTAMVASGLVTGSWTFHGFLPSKASSRNAMLSQNASADGTVIYFESPSRLVKTLQNIQDLFGPDRVVCVARELTKLHEEIITRPVSEVLQHFLHKAVKGEIVILISESNREQERDPDQLLRELLTRMSVSKAAAEAAQFTGLPKRELYQRALQLKEDS